METHRPRRSPPFNHALAAHASCVSPELDVSREILQPFVSSRIYPRDTCRHKRASCALQFVLENYPQQTRPPRLGWLSGVLTVPSSVRSPPSPSKRNQLYIIPLLPPPVQSHPWLHARHRRPPTGSKTEIRFSRKITFTTCADADVAATALWPYAPWSKSIAFTPAIRRTAWTIRDPRSTEYSDAFPRSR